MTLTAEEIVAFIKENPSDKGVVLIKQLVQFSPDQSAIDVPFSDEDIDTLVGNSATDIFAGKRTYITPEDDPSGQRRAYVIITPPKRLQKGDRDATDDEIRDAADRMTREANEQIRAMAEGRWDYVNKTIGPEHTIKRSELDD